MGDSIVDLGAGAADYVGEKLSDIYDYMMGAPKARASERKTYIVRGSPRGQQLYSGEDPNARTSILDYIGFDEGGAVPNGSAVNLGAGGFTDFSSMSMDEALYGTSDPVEISRRTRPSYDEFGQGYDYRDGQFQPAATEEGYNLELTEPARKQGRIAGEFEQEFNRANPYSQLADPMFPMSDVEALGLLEQGQLFGPGAMAGKHGIHVPSRVKINDDGTVTQTPIGFQNGGNPAIEEAGILSALWNAPNAEAQNLVRESGREGSEGSSLYYPEGALTFEQRLEQEYGYPSVPREMSDAPESVRNQRPRPDMPTFQELEDARAHALMSAEMAKQFGPETATKLGNFAEGIDALPIPLIGNATPEDVAMDKRNNAFGVKLLREAGVNATLPEIARMVDDKVFEQLDQILGREPGSRSFRSPSTGIDVYFPRNEQGFFQTSRSGYY